MKHKKYYWVLIVFLPIQWVLIQYLSAKPALVERFYSTGIYPHLSEALRFLLGWIPFSIGDVLYILLAFLLLKNGIKVIRKRKVNLLKVFASISIIYFVFQFLWGINYLREPIETSFEIDSTTYSTEELEEFTNKLIIKINSIQLKLTKNDTLKVVIPYSKKMIYDKVKLGYTDLEKDHSHVIYKNNSIKHSIISLPLSYMGFSGYLNPFTGEAQVNSLNPVITYPATSCHEVAHQLGFAAENEANFIGFLASVKNDDLYFQYSGLYMALRYALNDLYRHDKQKYKDAFNLLHKGVIKNMIENQKHWEKYKNPFEPFFKLIFNQFLKANKQKSGIKSYNLMVGLLINYEKKHGNLF